MEGSFHVTEGSFHVTEGSLHVREGSFHVTEAKCLVSHCHSHMRDGHGFISGKRQSLWRGPHALHYTAEAAFSLPHVGAPRYAGR